MGIFFQQEADGSVYVKTIVSGGSAERDGLVRVGDMILAVDGREVSDLCTFLPPMRLLRFCSNEMVFVAPDFASTGSWRATLDIAGTHSRAPGLEGAARV